MERGYNMGGRWLNRQKDWLKEWQSDEETVRSAGRPPISNEDYGVKFYPLRCPKCSSKDVKCYSSHPPIRYHYCRKCGHNFKSVEVNGEK